MSSSNINRKRQAPDEVEKDAGPTSSKPRHSIENVDHATSAEVRLTHEDYTVVWISALPFEVAAAEAMLDRQYQPPLQPVKGDPNYYIFGNIGEHNVVIVSFSKGLYGEYSASEALINARRTFPAIQYGLVVGICGGIPRPNRDIRLGDIIVGTLVAPYTAGKATARGFERIRGDIVPNEDLLRIVEVLEAKRERNEEKISEQITRILEERLEILPGFEHPCIPDYLYKPGYAHEDDKMPQCLKCGDPDDHTEQREPRPSLSPRVHAGTVASGDILVRDNFSRDTMLAQDDALCFEMESAGAMRALPCLPIRGVANYADEHKNDAWQRYAAANAAAYARELLETLPSSSARES